MTVEQLISQHSPGFVATALLICIVAGWLLATLIRSASTAKKKSHRARWLAGTSIIAGLGVWTTHFVAMLGYRPDMMLGYSTAITIVSAAISIAVVGGPLALSAITASWVYRAALGGLAGLGIGAMHYTGMAAISGCLQIYSPVSVIIGCSVGACCLALARGLPSRWMSAPATCLLFTASVCGTHFIAIGGTSLTQLVGTTWQSHNSVTLSIFTAAGAIVLFLGAYFTILTARLFEAQERAHSTILSTALHNMSNGLIYYDVAGRLQLFNSRYLEIFGIDEDALRRGMTCKETIEATGNANGWNRERRAHALRRSLHWIATNTSETIDHQMDDGRSMAVEVRSVDGGGVVMTFDDVTKERDAQRRIVELAFSDSLTQLANRRALQQRMEDDFFAKQQFKLLLIDLDRFKSVNDTYGHGVGDQLLVQVAGRLKEVAGSTAFVARLGGDEMAILVDGDRDAVTALAEQILDKLARPFTIDGLTIAIGCSVGICCTADAQNAAELMQFSDIALYASKRHGRGRMSFYSPGMVEAVTERAQMETDLRIGLDRGEFHLEYQPVVSLIDDRLIGYEALIRWNHPKFGPVPPARFIPLAEETGQIVEIGAWVLKEACRQAATLPKHLYVAVNVSAVQFRSPLLLSHLTQALDGSGLPAFRLEIELTATALVEDIAKIAETLGVIRALGVKVAMDDFGNGYSSLSHLRDLPLDRIKVDRSFVATAETDRHSMAVLWGMIQIAQKLDIAILAEGVETQSQLDMLRSIGCDAVQGYFIGKPMRLPSEPETCLLTTL